MNNVETRPLTGAGSPAPEPSEDRGEQRVAVPCNVCGHWLVDPLSVQLGVGPRCRGDADG
ncbi:DUF6011 domain-containing protein [Mycolicibacterium brisbanense]|uniref:DUF6011 domain-containing protein n=1 Tax=Mycolicibacterium brisbanense TaxID=146020 RepID=UPI002ADE52BB|nr:DUF6011 domain-containing protein [Mycolicibacterium brisbanense]